MSLGPQRGRRWTAAEISEGGERVSHLHPNDCYFAHLSIYAFARGLCADKVVLDAGSGAGYGAAYLAERGASSVLGCELDEEAVAFSRHYFQRPNLEYRAADLQTLDGLAPASFDVVFSSNVLEHVPDVLAFLRRAWELIKVDGHVIIAVPPIVGASDWETNKANPYHLNLWTPRQWVHAVSSFFAEAKTYRHWLKDPETPVDFMHSPEECSVSEEDFVFEPIAEEDFGRLPSFTVVILASGPRDEPELPERGTPITFVDESFSRPPARLSGSSWWRRTLPGRLLLHGISIARSQGLRALGRATLASVRRRLTGTPR